MNAKITIIIVILILAGILIFGARDKEDKDLGDKLGSNYVLLSFEEPDTRCLGSDFRQAVIRNDRAYQSLIDASPDLHPNPFLTCIDYQFPAIDFNQKTLLAHTVNGSGCSHTIERQVFRSDLDKEVIYNIEAQFIGSCEKAISQNNFILIPQVPENYSVAFRVKEE